MKRLRVFMISFMVSAIFFSFPAYAEFGTTDSNNLSSIRTDVSYIRTTLNGIASSCTSIYNQISYVTDAVRNFQESFQTLFGNYATDLHNQLDLIYDLLDDSLSSELKEDSFILNESFVATYSSVQSLRVVSSSGTVDLKPIELADQATSANALVVQSSGYSGVTSITFTGPVYNTIRLSPGYYDISLNVRPNLSTTSFSFTFLDKSYSITNGHLNITSYNQKLSYGGSLTINFSTPVTIPSGQITVFLYVYKVDDQILQDSIASSAMNPDQEGTVSDVDDAGHQQSQQEEEMWQNINSYKGDLSFNLDGWDDAAGGLSYVTGVFMTVWNNSPTQPIVLSLMLGIAMLSIGRGVSAAVRASSRRGDKDA